MICSRNINFFYVKNTFVSDCGLPLVFWYSLGKSSASEWVKNTSMHQQRKGALMPDIAITVT